MKYIKLLNNIFDTPIQQPNNLNNTNKIISKI